MFPNYTKQYPIWSSGVLGYDWDKGMGQIQDLGARNFKIF